MVDHLVDLNDRQGRVAAKHKDYIMHSFSVGCKFFNVYESFFGTAVESADVETGLF